MAGGVDGDLSESKHIRFGGGTTVEDVDETLLIMFPEATLH